MDQVATAPDTPAEGPLTGLRVLDLSRILAGPTCTQMLGDLGAEVLKIESPGSGDDTRGWGPPFLPDDQGRDSDRSAYFICTNRNKRSVQMDLADPADRARLEPLIARADVVIENFRPGGLAKFGLAHDQLAKRHPRLIYCSISGFGQTGPRRSEAGYDFLVQAMGGLMSLTGEPDGAPMKVGVAITDLMCGMYASVAILAALQERHRSGRGQHIDLSLFDTQLACLANQASSHLMTGRVPQRQGNEHPSIVPYRAFAAADRHIVLTIGNDGQFARWCDAAGLSELASDPRFATNAARVRNRDALHALMDPAIAARPAAFWLEEMKARGVPCGPVNTVAEALADPQAQARGMVVTMPGSDAPDAPELRMLGNPLRFSRTPVRYRLPPPALGGGEEQVRAWLGDPAD